MLDNQRKKIKKVVKGLTKASRSHKKQANTLKKVLKKTNAKRT
jgi:hypothetical protein|tara:strand:+ start:998 stop:1126 length:129 start_codon:yes stop_codon:yes gene_type:complete